MAAYKGKMTLNESWVKIHTLELYRNATDFSSNPLCYKLLSYRYIHPINLNQAKFHNPTEVAVVSGTPLSYTHTHTHK